MSNYCNPFLDGSRHRRGIAVRMPVWIAAWMAVAVSLNGAAESTDKASSVAPRGGAKRGVTEETWWSLKPLVRPAVPVVPNPAARVANPIDAFVLARLAEKGLAPSPEADRRTLIRRLYFDLIGLPPTPAAVDAFLADPDPKAYEHLVDRLLALQQYG